MVLTRSDSGLSAWVLPLHSSTTGDDGPYTIPDRRQIAQIQAILVQNLSLEPTWSAPDPPPLATPNRFPFELTTPTSSSRWPGLNLDNTDDGIRPLAGPSAQTRRRRAASTATVAGEWAGAPRPSQDRILLASSTTPASAAAAPPAFRRSASAGLLPSSSAACCSRSRSSTITLAAGAGASRIDEEETEPTTEAHDSPAAFPSTGALPPLTRTRSASRASVASSAGSTSTIREAPRVPRDAHSRSAVLLPSEPETASSIRGYSTDLPPPRRREKQKRRPVLEPRLVDSFVSLELLPPSSSSALDATASPNTLMTHGRSRSGSARNGNYPAGGGGGAPSMSRSGSTGSVHGASSQHHHMHNGVGPSPRKGGGRRRAISSALFAPLSRPTTAASAAPDPPDTPTSPPPNPFFVSDVVPPATHASFFLDPEKCVLPALEIGTASDSTTASPAAFPEEVRNWSGWRESRFKATLWGREDPAWARVEVSEGKGKGKVEEEKGKPSLALEEGWRVLVEWEVDLAGLTSLGRDPAEFPKLPPNTLVFALSTAGGAVPSFPTLDPSSSSGPSASAAAAANLPPADHLEYFSAPIPLLQKAYRRRVRAARRARTAILSALKHQQQQRSWSEDELSDYYHEYCCDDEECSSCDGAGGLTDDEDEGVMGGHASDPGVAQAGGRGIVSGGRSRSDTIRSRRAAAGRRGTVSSVRHGSDSSRLRPPSSTSQQQQQGALDADEERRRKRLRAEEVLEKSRRETRMVRAAGWDEMRKLCEARWELEKEREEIRRAAVGVEIALGEEETGWAALERLRSELQDRLEDLEGVKEAVDVELSEEQHELSIRAALLRQRRERLEQARRLEIAQLEQLDQNSAELDRLSQNVTDMTQSTRTRQTQLITLLSHIFPIEPVPIAPRGISSDLLFSILGIALPNSTFPSSYSDDLASTALGYAAQVTQLLAAYLAVPLAYPITCRGSRSYLRDEISVMKGSRAFPLFARGVERYRFDYGVFLLNKNIEQLMFSQGLTVLDLRNTLPNLMTLMLSLSYDPSHDDYLASTLLPTGPFAAAHPALTTEELEDEPSTSTEDPTSKGRADTLQGNDRATVTTRSSRSGSNASTIRPSKLNGTRDVNGDSNDVPTSSQDATDAASLPVTEPASTTNTKFAPTGRKGRRAARRRSSSSASEKITLVTTVQKTAQAHHGRSSSSGSTASNGSGGSTATGGGGGGYGAKLREGLWTVVAGSAGRRDSSGPRETATTAAVDNRT
ncbi:hypothetical protein JCM10908_001064 [Rhodotorula pacifica]|uniref:uncharacterized protein n=1 Tax=Rhodotorula pacifica TaxID=1495444 RepID=UPI003171CB66